MNYFLLGACLLISLAGCKQDAVIPTATTSTGSTSTSGSSKAITFASSDWMFWVSNWVSNGVSNGSKENPNQYQSSLTTDVITTTSPMGSTGIGGLPVTTKSESYLLGMAATTIKDIESYSYWMTSLPPPKTLQPGKSLTLRAKIQLQNVQGKGVSFALRGDRTTQSAVLFATTQDKINLSGTNDFTEYSVTLPYTTSVDYILIYFVFLPQTTGKVLLKDVSLQVN